MISDNASFMSHISFAVPYFLFCLIFSGSLGTSVSDPDTFIAGASGGVYALISAHLATLILNWKEDSAVKIKKVIHKPLTRMVRLIFIVFLTSEFNPQISDQLALLPFRSLSTLYLLYNVIQ